jgi:hypothetical protein
LGRSATKKKYIRYRVYVIENVIMILNDELNRMQTKATVAYFRLKKGAPLYRH